MPGPDGIPACAYKAVGDLAVNSLFDVVNILRSDNAHDVLVQAYSSMHRSQAHDFNMSILCLLPKKVAGEDETSGAHNHPNDTRPSNISDVDNRFFASAAR